MNTEARTDPSPWCIPSSWSWVRIGQIADVIGGGTPRSNDPTNFEGGTIPWITPADLSGYTEKYISFGARNITQKGLDGSGARLMPAGTVLMSSRAPIGYVAIAAQPVSTNQGFKSFVLPSGIYPDYLYYYLKRAKDLVVELASGTTFLEISGAKSALIPFPVAPVPEQQRIVAAIEEQFTRLDAAVAGLKRTQANLKRYRAALLGAACSGRLVPTEAELARQEGRDYEPADQLLQRILTERRERWETDQLAKMQAQGKVPKGDAWKGKYVEADLPDSRVDVPVGWCTCTLGLLALASDGMITGPFGTLISKDDYRDSGIPISGIPNISRSGYLDKYSTFLSPEKAESLEKYFIRSGDLIVSRSGTVGEICVVPELHDTSVMSTNLMRIRVVPSDIPSQWLIINFKGNFALQAQIEDLCKGSTRVFLNLGILSSLEIPIPPIAELNRIVTEVEHKTSVIDELERSTQHALIRAERLRQSILRRAFEGTLVPQDPTDEPADVLLERIRAERAKTVPNGRQRRTRAPKTTRMQPLFDLQEVGETE